MAESKDFTESDELIQFFQAYTYIMALEARKKLEEMKESDTTPQRLPEIDEKIVKNVKFLKTKPPRCKGCKFYREYGLDDPKRYVFIVESKISVLPFLFLKPDSRYVIDREWFYDDYKKLFIIACPTIECGVSRPLDKVDVDTFLASAIEPGEINIRQS